MIWESQYWKDGLLRHAKDLRRRKKQRRWPEASLARVEQDVMVAFYSIRKLIEAEKVATETKARPVVLQRHKWRGKQVTRMNWHKLNELYELEESTSETRDLRWVANQLIHSYVFVVCFDDYGGFDGVFFTSDKNRNKSLHRIGVDQMIDLYEHVGTDYPNEMHMIMNPKTGDFDVHAVTNRD